MLVILLDTRRQLCRYWIYPATAIFHVLKVLNALVQKIMISAVVTLFYWRNDIWRNSHRDIKTFHNKWLPHGELNGLAGLTFKKGWSSRNFSGFSAEAFKHKYLEKAWTNSQHKVVISVPNKVNPNSITARILTRKSWGWLQMCSEWSWLMKLSNYKIKS